MAYPFSTEQYFIRPDQGIKLNCELRTKPGKVNKGSLMYSSNPVFCCVGWVCVGEVGTDNMKNQTSGNPIAHLNQDS